MITVKADQLSEQHLAEVALAIQNRWNVATFVKMHEIIVMDDELYDEPSSRVLTVPLKPDEIERGINVILENLELDRAFRLERSGKGKYKIKLLDPAKIPRWVEKATSDVRQPPEGVFACPHCVLPDAVILGDNKPISEYSTGDFAIGQSGLTKVTRTFARPYKGQMIVVKPIGMLPIITTPEHPILTTFGHTLHRKRGGRSCNETRFGKERWTAAKDLIAKTSHADGNYVILPIIGGSYASYQVELSFTKTRIARASGYGEYFPLSIDTAWLLGLFTAGGSVNKEVQFSISRNRNKKATRRKVYKIVGRLGYSTCTRIHRAAHSMLVTIPSPVLAQAFDAWCGHKASNKKIPEFILFHADEEILRAFLDGYEAGHNHIDTKKMRGSRMYRVSVTTSRILAEQLQLAYGRLGKWTSIHVSSLPREKLMMGRRCSSNSRYSLSYALEPNLKRQKSFFLGNRILSPIRSISEGTFEGRVHNLQTSDQTYLVSNAIVHNCGKWFASEFELSMHTKLHYII